MGSHEEVRGERVTIEFEARKCIHSRHCVLDRPDVFVPNVEGEWIHPDRATPEEVAAIARSCPSGAITYTRHDGGPQEGSPLVNVVRVRENGPLALHADVEIVGHGRALRATLCRCGASKRKPFCDSGHVTAGFRSTGEPEPVESKPLAHRAGALTVTPQPDGPLLVEGNLEICAGTGKTVNRTTRTELCRCGQSANKPYCDGSHARVGFKTG